MLVADTPPAGPPPVLQLAGHPVRWRLLSELALTDLTVRELVDRVGEPQNLVSYHLGKLRSVGLVSTRRSSADRRDAYYAMDLARFGAMVSGAGAALHPGLEMHSPEPSVGPGDALPAARVLFLCTGNSARSQMAEAMLRARTAGGVAVHSAGSRPKLLHPHAVRVMSEHFGLDISGARTKSLDEFAGTSFDCVVTLCDRVREVCPDFPGPARRVHWSIPDPADPTGIDPTGADPAGIGPFEDVAAELSSRIDFLVPLLRRPPLAT